MENGKAVEAWLEMDTKSFLEQFGAAITQK